MAGTVLAPTTIVSDKSWTVADIEQMPRGYRYEILDGVLYMAAMPKWPHPGLVENLQRILIPWVHAQGVGRLLSAQTGIYLNDRNYVDPDLIFLRTSQFPDVGGYLSTAALAIEVLSPSNFRAPREEREAFFVRAGVEELWYVDYGPRTLEVRRLAGAGYETERLFQGDDPVSSAQLPGLEFSLTALWEDLGE
jgi:Uma2 family endonuclease